MKNIIKFIFILSLLPVFYGCWGIQDSYDYEPSNVSPYLNMTAWEFIESRQDTFSLFKQAIQHVDNTYTGFKDYYTQTDRQYTYMFLNNNAFTGSSGILANAGATTVGDMNPALLRDILLYHIVEGYYHSLDVSGSLSFDPINVITLLKTQDAVMTLRINDLNSRPNYSRLVANYNAGTSTARTAVTSNLIATNGVIHVFSYQLIYKP